MSSTENILRVALPTPLMRLFDYLPPATGRPVPGQRVEVPFGRRSRIGIIVAVVSESSVAPDRLRQASRLLDTGALLDTPLMAMLEWAAAYYQHPLGEVCATALPAALRQGGEPAAPPPRWTATADGHEQDLAQLIKRAPQQARLLDACRRSRNGISREDLDVSARTWRDAITALARKGLVEGLEEAPAGPPDPRDPEPGPSLTEAQRQAVATVNATEGFACFLLEGVTGSGKTEVYLECIEQQRAAGRQSLVLVPEIGLTPQLIDRFQRRLGVPVAVLHSGLSDGDRLRAWSAVADGSASVLVGTRSAIFAPLQNAGLIIVDEEHDSSFKQQDGFRYSARDLAVWRGRQLGVPVILGSATPSFESLENAQAGRYQKLVLPERPGSARQPSTRLIDLRRHPARDGLSEPLLAAIQSHLAADGQVLIYLNRRGYAPTMMCPGCGTMSECPRCDARMVYHRARARLVCHHCGVTKPAPTDCADCGTPLQPVGQGTERLETALRELFPAHPLLRIDRDTTRRRGAMEEHLAAVHSGSARLLLGTQMLTKGHDFPNVTLVGIIDADQGLFGTDFRASERLAQSFIQVAGRAGRAERPGEVCIQTVFPDHPLLQTLVHAGYPAFAEQALLERQAAGWPPYGFLGLLRAEAPQRQDTFAFLEAARDLAGQMAQPRVSLLGPAPAPMERRQGRYRGQLLARSGSRAALQSFLTPWRLALEELPAARRVRWSLDVDPGELF